MVESSDSSNPANNTPDIESTGNRYRPLRIWPAILLVALMFAAKFIPLQFDDESTPLLIIMILGPPVIGLLILAWWVFLSRATMTERIAGLLACITAGVATLMIADKSLLFENSLIGPGIIIVLIPLGTAMFALGAVLASQILSMKRIMTVILFAVVGFGFTALLKSDGMWGNGQLDLSWRWTESSEQKLLDKRNSLPKTTISEEEKSKLPQWLATPEWPRFRGPDGVSRFEGPAIDTNWSSNPPREIWRIPVGPGWSSFAIAGNLLFTQEQHGDQEAVVCYAADSGKEIWVQQLESRFSDPLGGPGPRATPTLANGKLFALGARGILQCIDPITGDVHWVKDISKVANRTPPTWGFSSSPLVVESSVIVHAGGEGDLGTLAFDAESGELKWSASAGDHSYSSPEVVQFNDTTYVGVLTNTGLHLNDPESGESALNYEWECAEYRALQPQMINTDSILIPTQELGTRLLRLESDSNGIQTETLWTSRNLKPDFNDFVVFENHAYGFDGMIFTCIDLDTGERKWKQGRYGKGQVLLLEQSNTLLVMSEKGQIVLLKADPSEHQELTKFSALNDRTWNHPVIVGNRLYVRNSSEAVCYELNIPARNAGE